MKSRLLSAVAMLALALIVLASPAMADHYTFPSSNEANSTQGWSHFVVVDDQTPGQVTLTFTNPRGFVACFEYRVDGVSNDAANFNPNAHGLYPYYCTNSSRTETIFANNFVEIRMVFGGEADERFDWTYVEVVDPIVDPMTKEECMNGGYAAFGFANQGQCIRFVNTGQDNRP